MNYYIDISIKPDAKMRENLLLNKVYTKLHKRLYDLKTSDVGVSFPDYKIKLGKIIRIHATNLRLQEIIQDAWLGDLLGYCDVSVIQKIPDQVRYRTISRKQSNMTEAKLRRLIKRGSILQDEIKGYKAKMFQQGIYNPYLELVSGSNDHKHRRYIQFGELVDQAISGKFDIFGLSKNATIPWF